MSKNNGNDTMMNDIIVMVRQEKTRIIQRDRTMNYSQNDTVIIIMNGIVEIIDKRAFRDMLNVASKDDEVESDLAEALLQVFKAN